MSANPSPLQDTVFQGGMNEGIDPTVLPATQLEYMQNARVRKPGRVGKRNGTLVVPLTKSATVRNTGGAGIVANGALSGNFCGLGDRMCVVNDTAYSFSEQKQIWYDQFLAYDWQNAGSGVQAGVANNRAPFGHVSGWRVASSTFSGYQEKGAAANVSSMDTAYFDGLHWVCSENTASSGGGTDVQVLALDPATDRVVYQYQIGGSKPRLLLVGATLCMLYIDATAQVRASQFVSYNAGFMGGFSGGGLVNPLIAGIIIGSATSGYHAVPFSSTQILLAYLSGANTITLKLLTVIATGISVTTTTAYNPVAAGPYHMSIASDPGVGVTLAFRANDANIYTRQFSTVIVATGAEVNYGNGEYRPAVLYSAPSGPPIIVWNQGPGTINTAYLNAGAMTHRMQVAGAWTNVSYPFYVGAVLYVWAEAERETATSFQRYLFLLQLDDPINGVWSADGPDVTYVAGYELSVQDSLVSYAQDVTSAKMWLGKTTLGANGYIFASPFVRATPGTSGNTALRLLQANHYSETVRRRSICVQPARGAQLMAGGVLSAFYTTGAYEVGFLNAPIAAAGAPGVGGSMTAGADYFYAFVYRWVNPNGETELSAPAAGGKITLGAGDGHVTLSTSPSLYVLGQKSGVALDIYRSTGGSVFFYVGTADMNSLTYSDTMSDATAGANGVLYTQVGQELENRAPPGCRFLCVSQNRLWCGGLANPRLIQSSKSFQTGVAIAFADSDAFRVTLPDACTGLAFLDSVVAFTRNAIYVISGDGPDNDGSNGWLSPVALPFPIGCIDWRSVVVTEEGVFFQSDRGIYMLPRGFGEPIPAGDAIMEQIRTYPICTGATVVTRGDGTPAAGSSAESTVRWSFCQEETCSHGLLVVYDRVHKAWSIDTLTNPGANQNGLAFISTWQDGQNALTPGLGAPGGRMALALDTTTPQFGIGAGAVSLLRESTPGEYANAGFGDVQPVGGAGNAYFMLVRTGQIRPFGLFGHGLIHRVGALGYVQSTTSININKTTDLGTGSSSLATGAAGKNAFWEFALGNQEGRDVNNLQVEFNQADSSGEGVLFNGFVLELGEAQGFKKVVPDHRGT